MQEGLNAVQIGIGEYEIRDVASYGGTTKWDAVGLVVASNPREWSGHFTGNRCPGVTVRGRSLRAVLNRMSKEWKKALGPNSAGFTVLDER